MEKKRAQIACYEDLHHISQPIPLFINVLGYGDGQYDQNNILNLANPSSFCVHYILSGNGIVEYENSSKQNIKQGDLIFTLPQLVLKAYSSENKFLKYTWIDFSGSGISEVFSKLGIENNYLILHSKNTASINRLFKNNMQHCSESPDYADIICKSTLYQLFYFLLKELAPPNAIFHNVSYIENVQNFIENNYYNPKLSLTMIAESCNLNKVYLSRLFVKETSIPLSKYITTVRIKKACDLFNKGETLVKKVAIQVGFDSQYYFSKVFHSIIQITPSDYIKGVKKEESVSPSES